jgi:hypothetical protein
MYTYFVATTSSAKTSDYGDDEEDAREVMGSRMAAGEAELMEFAADEALGTADLDAMYRKLVQRLNQNTSG